MKFKDMKLNLSKNYGDKKVFDCDQVPLSDLVNMEIEILDFETNVKTSYGDNRCVVKFKMDGAEKKYITSSSKMIQELEAIKEQYGFPFEATINKHKLFQFASLSWLRRCRHKQDYLINSWLLQQLLIRCRGRGTS